MRPATEDRVFNNWIDLAFNTLKRGVLKQLQQCDDAESFESIESNLQALFVECERQVLEKTLSELDVNVPSLEIDGTRCRQVLRDKMTYYSSAGPLRIERSLYRARGAAITQCPLEQKAGIVERRWTPRAAKQAVFAVSQLTPYEAQALFAELGRMTPSRSSLDRLPKKLGAQWEGNRSEFEASLRDYEIPMLATSVAVSLDGVKVPMQGGVVLPGDSRYEEASCGSITFYDKDGEPLLTRRYGRMPESHKLTTKAFLKAEIDHALSLRPDLQLVKVADGAKDNWTFLDSELPAGLSVLDFYHATEHLKNGFDLIFGKDSAESHGQFTHYRHRLRHEVNGIDAVIRCLAQYVRKKPKSTALKAELNYFKNNKHRCQYATTAEQHFPIGSGIVEATCKTLVAQRLKRSGMAWQTIGGQAILTFRALLQSHQFDQGWALLSKKYKADVKMPGNVVSIKKRVSKILRN